MSPRSTRPLPDASGDRDVEDRREYLQALHADYVALRSDQQSLNTVIAALFSLAVVIFGPLGYFLTTSCHLSSLTCPGYPAAMLAVVPLGPLGIIGFYSVLSNVNLIRSYYIRAVENEMQRVADSPEITFRGSGPIRLPSFAHIVETLVSQRRGVMHYRLLNLITVASLGILFIGTTGLCVLFARPIDVQILAGAFYLSALALLIISVRDDTRGGLSLWRFATRYVGVPSADITPTRSGRPLVSYLLLPRPGDLLYKGSIIPLAWLLAGVAAASLTVEAFGLTIALAAVFELLFYQARYIINDLRGLGVDAAYSAFKRGNRFPAWAGRREVRTALGVVAFRVATALWISIRLIPQPYSAVLLIGMGAVTVQAVLYETIRARVSSRVGRDLLALTVGRTGILALVGVGYGIRAAIGLLLGHVSSPDWTLVGVGAAMMTAFGGMFVTMTWTIDGIAQVIPRPGEGLPTDRYSPGLEGDSHIAPLLAQARMLHRRDGTLEPASPDELTADQRHRLDRMRPLRSLSSPTWWNVMLLLAAPLAAMVGVRLAGDHRAASVAWSAAIGVVVAVGVLVTHRGGLVETQLRIADAAGPLLPVVILAAGAAGLVWLAAMTGTQSTALAWTTLALVGLVYLFFRGASRQLVLFDPALVAAALHRALRAAVRRIARLLVGGEAARRLLDPDPQDAPREPLD